jgi:hypothetical protein
MQRAEYTPPVYFSDVFEVNPETVDDYGAFDIALVNDLPLFVDPFLLFDSENEKYRALHDQIIKYLVFIKDRALAGELTDATIRQWLTFGEVKQNWLGFSKTGNGGTGLGPHFANSLARNFATVFRKFGSETITTSSHIEKLGLLSGGVGRDHLSDFTTNLIKGFLAKYTEDFATAQLRADQVRVFKVDKVVFDYETRRWKSASFKLPFFQGDFVLLTPKEILTREEAWINQGDMLDQFTQVQVAVADDQLREQIDAHFMAQINEQSTSEDRKRAILKTYERFEELVDIYIKQKEEDAPEAHVESDRKVKDTETQFIANVRALIQDHLAGTEFCSDNPDSLEETRRRVAYLKHVIEDNYGYRLFYLNGKPIKREADLHVMFRLTWFATAYDVNSEVNNGRGPVDYKVSMGKRNASLVEFKLASNTGLEKNLRNQVAIYEKASGTTKSMKVILFFTDAEFSKIQRILRDLKLDSDEKIVVIDARADNKPSASKAA